MALIRTIQNQLMKTFLFCFVFTVLFSNTFLKPIDIALENKRIDNQFDTLYTNKKYKISLSKINDLETSSNTIFKIYKNNKMVFENSIYNTHLNNIYFEDFNGDLIDDILVQYSSSARSNESFTLFLVDTLNDSFKRIKRFEEIPNPRYIAEYDIISNYVLSGKNWSGFYKIHGDTIFDFGLFAEDDMTEESNYDKEYKEAIEKIKKIKSAPKKATSNF